MRGLDWMHALTARLRATDGDRTLDRDLNDVRAWRVARDLAQDVRYAGRSLRRAPRVHDRRRRDDLPPQSATGIV
jgi:hypothetical protein